MREIATRIGGAILVVAGIVAPGWERWLLIGLGLAVIGGGEIRGWSEQRRRERTRLALLDFKNQGEFIQRTVGVLGPPLYDPNHPNNPHYWKSVEHEYERFTKWDSAVRVYVRAELDAIKVDRFGRPDALTLRPAPYSQPQPAVRLWDALEVRIKRLDQWINSENG